MPRATLTNSNKLLNRIEKLNAVIFFGRQKETKNQEISFFNKHREGDIN